MMSVVYRIVGYTKCIELVRDEKWVQLENAEFCNGFTNYEAYLESLEKITIQWIALFTSRTTAPNRHHRIVIFSNFLNMFSKPFESSAFSSQSHFLSLASSIPLLLLLFIPLCGS